MTNWLEDPNLMKMTCRRFTPLPDVFLQGEDVTESKDEPQEMTVARAEARARARQRRNGSRQLRGTDRQFAEALHREADSLHYKGDYETALVLYHRAASVCPRDSSHGVAARRTAAAINALSHPSKALNGLLPKVRNGAQQSAMVCPESAALRASQILTESSDPVSVVPQIIGFFDGRADFWRTPKPRVLPPRKSRTTVEKSTGTATPTTQIMKMETVLNSGDPTTALWIGGEILKRLSYDSTAESNASHRYEATIQRLFALAHVALGRHDRAVASASRMTRAALTVDVPVLIIQALVTLGKVHLTFGHLKAAAQAWEVLVPCVPEPVPRAWLFHEIGRCYLENGDHKKALQLAVKCLDIAEAVDSDKWTFHGRLLLGQTLAQLGRFAEAASALRSLTLAGEEAGDARTIAYVRDLAERLFHASNGQNERSKVQRSWKYDEENFQDYSTQSGCSSEPKSQTYEDQEEETPMNRTFSDITDNESRCSDGSSLSLDTDSPRTIFDDKQPSKFEITTAASNPDDCGVQESSIVTISLEEPSASRESVLTGCTYGVSSPHFRRSISKTGTSRRRDVSDSETVSTIFGT